MTAPELAAELARRGILVTANGDKLRYRGPTAAVTDEILDALREHKPTLLAVARRLEPPRYVRITCRSCGWHCWEPAARAEAGLCGACRAGKPPLAKCQWEAAR